jgi:RNA polymerase sigma-70 factor (ECF subfamily)
MDERPSVRNATDLELIEQTLRGDSHAFDELVLRYQDRLVHSLEHALSSREDALEIAQQAFVLAWRKLGSFRRESQFYSWLYRIARNVAASQTRRQQLSSTSLDQLYDAKAFEPSDRRSGTAPDHASEQADQVRIVQNALKQVSEEFRQPLILKEMDGFSYEEIADILEIPIGTVRSRIFRARQELIDLLRRALKLSDD